MTTSIDDACGGKKALGVFSSRKRWLSFTALWKVIVEGRGCTLHIIQLDAVPV